MSETSVGSARIFAGALVTNDNGEMVLDGTELPSDAGNVAVSNDGRRIFYTVRGVQGTTGYIYDTETGETSTRFTTALRHIRVNWEPGLYIQTLPSVSLTGYAYEGASLTRLAGYKRGLMLTPAARGYALTYLEDGAYVSYSSETQEPLAITVFPEKCTKDATEAHVLWCGAPLALPAATYPDAWYQGTVSFDDSIWQLDLRTGSAALVSIPSEDVGEPIDAVNLAVSRRGDMLLFTNKQDGSLWLQEIE